MLCVSRTCFILFLLYFIFDLSYLFIDSIYLFFLVFHLINIAFFGVFMLRFFEYIGPLVYLKLYPPTLFHLFFWNICLKFYLLKGLPILIYIVFIFYIYIPWSIFKFTYYIIYIFWFRTLAFFLLDGVNLR